MALPLQITIRDIPATETLTNHIREKVNKLSQFNNNIISCHIVVELPQKNQHQGKIYNVRIDLTIPREEIVVNKVQNENVFIAIRDAVNATIRRMQSHSRKLRGEVKNHLPLTHGKVVRLFPEDDCGFIEALNGDEYYFQRGNVAYPEFDQLDVGTQVQFLEVIAGLGKQANRVTAGKHQPLESQQG